MITAVTAGVRSTFRSLAVRNYRIYFWGGLVSNVGTWMQRTAQAWLVLQLSGSGAALGLVALLQFGPSLVFSVAAGALSDRFPKQHVLVITQVLAGVLSLATGLLDLLGVLTLGQLYTVALLTGVVFAFDVPARQAFASELVGRQETVNAVGLNTASFNVARLLGPPAAGLVIAGFTTWASFFLHALSAVAIVVSLVRIDPTRLHRAPRPTVGEDRSGVWGGFRFLAAHPVVIGLIVSAAATAAIGANSLQVVIPLVATEVFGGGPVHFGLLTSALALGGLVGALAASSTAGIPRLRWVFGAAACLGVVQFVSAFAPTMIVFALVLIAVGACFMGFVVLINTRVQLSAPPEVRGRVIAVYMMFFMGGGALGAPLLGLLADEVGAMDALRVSGAFGLFCAVLVGGAVALGTRRPRAATGPPRPMRPAAPSSPSEAPCPSGPTLTDPHPRPDLGLVAVVPAAGPSTHVDPRRTLTTPHREESS